MMPRLCSRNTSACGDGAVAYDLVSDWMRKIALVRNMLDLQPPRSGGGTTGYEDARDNLPPTFGIGKKTEQNRD